MQAVLVYIEEQVTNKGIYYSPVYQYEFDGKSYTRQVSTTYTGFTVRKWNVGEIHNVWIDSSEPTSVVKDRKLTFGTFCILIFLIMCIMMPIVLL